MKRPGAHFFAKHCPYGGKYGVNFFGTGRGGNFTGGNLFTRILRSTMPMPFLPSFLTGQGNGKFIEYLRRYIPIPKFPPVGSGMRHEDNPGFLGYDKGGTPRYGGLIPPKASNASNLDEWFTKQLTHPTTGGSFKTFIKGAWNKFQNFQRNMPTPGEMLTKMPHFLEALVKSPKELFTKLTADPEGQGYRGVMNGGFLSAIPGVIMSVLPYIKPILGAAALGAAGGAGSLAIQKIFGKGLHKKDSPHLSLMQSYTPKTYHTPLHKIKAINNAHATMKAYDNLSPTAGGSLGQLMGKIWAGLSGIVKHHGTSAVRGLVKAGRKGLSEVDLGKVFSMDKQGLKDSITRGLKNLSGNVKQSAKEFGKAVVDKGGKMAGDKVLKHVDEMLDPKKQNQKKKAQKQLKRKAKFFEEESSTDSESDVPSPKQRRRKRTADEDREVAGLFAKLPAADVIAGQGRRRRAALLTPEQQKKTRKVQRYMTKRIMPAIDDSMDMYDDLEGTGTHKSTASDARALVNLSRAAAATHKIKGIEHLL